MGVNQRKYNSDRKLNLRLYDKALQLCTARNDTGENISKTRWLHFTHNPKCIIVNGEGALNVQEADRRHQWENKGFPYTRPCPPLGLPLQSWLDLGFPALSFAWSQQWQLCNQHSLLF